MAGSGLKAARQQVELLFSEVGHRSAIAAHFLAFGEENIHFVLSSGNTEVDLDRLELDEARKLFDDISGIEGGLRIMVSLADQSTIEHAAQYLRTSGFSPTSRSLESL